MHKYWIAFSSIEELGSSFIQKLYNHFGNIEEAFCANDLSFIEGLSKKSAETFFKIRDSINPDKILNDVTERGIKFLVYEIGRAHV